MTLHAISLAVHGLLFVGLGAESLSHVSIPMVLLVDQVVGCRDVIVSISFHASDRVLLLKVVVFDQLAEQFWLPGHLLKTWEETRVLRNFFLGWAVLAHELVVSDVLNSEPFLGVCT